MKKLDTTSKEYVTALMKISDEILSIANDRDSMPNGDFQGAIEAQVMTAIRFGFDQATKGA